MNYLLTVNDGQPRNHVEAICSPSQMSHSNWHNLIGPVRNRFHYRIICWGNSDYFVLCSRNAGIILGSKRVYTVSIKCRFVTEAIFKFLAAILNFPWRDLKKKPLWPSNEPISHARYFGLVNVSVRLWIMY